MNSESGWGHHESRESLRRNRVDAVLQPNGSSMAAKHECRMKIKGPFLRI
jgi:hypothetical protein